MVRWMGIVAILAAGCAGSQAPAERPEPVVTPVTSETAVCEGYQPCSGAIDYWIEDDVLHFREGGGVWTTCVRGDTLYIGVGEGWDMTSVITAVRAP
jgi:hypothetical protein